jgi:putative hemolysin
MIIRSVASLAVLLWTAPAVAQYPNPGSGGRAPNPAAVFCEQEGGRYRTIAEIGGARGVCVLQDGREVDAWDYFRERHSALPLRWERTAHMPFDRAAQREGGP